jgi:hypothetical protein
MGSTSSAATVTAQPIHRVVDGGVVSPDQSPVASV